MTEQALRKMIAAGERACGEKRTFAGKERSSDGKENGRRCIGSFE